MEVRRALVPVTGHPADSEAVRLACELARPHRGSVYLLHVIEVRRSEPVDSDIPEETVKQDETILAGLEELARDHRCPVEGDVVQARAAGPAVVEQAVEREVEAIVLSMPYRYRFGDFSLGDTVPYILRNAPCWVVLVRDPVQAAVATSSW